MVFFIACLGAFFGAASFYIYQKIRLSTFAQISKEMILAAEKKAKELQENAARQTKEHEHNSSIAALKAEHALRQKEEKQERKIQELSQKLTELEKKEKQWRQKQEMQDAVSDELKKTLKLAELALEKAASMSLKAAKQEILTKAQIASENECQLIFSKKLQEVEEKLETESTRLLLSTLMRLTSKQIHESQITSIELPSEEMKSRIIGRDGKNIRAFENVARVTLIIDEGAQVTISSFDAERRHIAKLALTELIKDGRINPARIEEVVKAIENALFAEYIKFGREAAFESQVADLHPEILRTLGKLKFKTSLGQNVLEHSIEVSHIMGLIAAELKLNEQKARRIGLLHDIGKALGAEAGASHAIAGQKFTLKYGEKEDVANGIGCHHDEIVPTSHEAALCKFADKISASRLGARSENIEKHTQKLESLEKLALEFAGVDSAYALQAGRELRVFVKPEIISDLQAVELAQSLAKKIEASHSSGKIKVQITVVREHKAVEFSI